MNLLPKRVKDFHEKNYWDKFFTKRKNSAFEWYGDYGQLCGILHKYIRNSDRILVVGCGNSQLSADLYDVGVRNITNVDISDIVIQQMKKKSEHRSGMQWSRMDVTKMDFEDGLFNVVLDKGTLDALMTDNSTSVVEQVDQMFLEIERVLKFGGRYICISLLQEHILCKILQWFTDRKWMIRVCRRPVDNRNVSNAAEGFDFPVFAVVCTKFKTVAGAQLILETMLHGDTATRTDVKELKQSVLALQQFAFLRHHVSQKTVSGEDVSFELFVEDNTVHPRYTIYVVDRSASKSAGQFAVFIVPQGRESEWLFGSFEGRQQLAESAGFERLAVVHLNRNHKYETLDGIKGQLSSRVMQLAPSGLSSKATVPFLSVGEGLGKRTVRFKGKSDLSGEFVVEDVEGNDGQLFRRLIFLSNANVVQSEARLIPDTKKSNKSRKKASVRLGIDPSYLACQHHHLMVAGVTFLPEGAATKHFKVLVIGLGGGGLPRFLHHVFPLVEIVVVDIDPHVVSLAKDWFGFQLDDRMTVHTVDGIQFTKGCVEQIYDLIMLDVDSKDTTIGMSCPPKSFIEPETLTAFKRLLTKTGVLVLNLVCRDSHLRHQVITNISQVFPKSFSYKIKDEVNEVVYGLNCAMENPLEKLKEKLECLNRMVINRTVDATSADDLVEVEDMVKSLTLCS